MRYFSLLVFISCLFSCTDPSPGEWQLLGFQKQNEINPVLQADTTTIFNDPVSDRKVKWEGKDVFNPASVVKDDTLFLLYRAEDFVGKYNGTSRIGLAFSLDGLSFHRLVKPVFYPEEDSFKVYEWEGGVEDPRIIERNDGMYFMTYTAYDGDLARLLIASSPDLRHWEKYGPAFKSEEDINTWSKSGSIVTRKNGQRLVAEKVNGVYWMYFGDTDLFVATSEDLVEWEPLKNENGKWLKVLSPRKGFFDSELVEPGPPAILTEAGIVLLYNSRNNRDTGDDELPDGTYAAGQALFDYGNPSQVTDRSVTYFIHPTEPYEITGQVNNVCFIEGLSPHKGKWFLYYGTADSKIAVTVSEQIKL